MKWLSKTHNSLKIKLPPQFGDSRTVRKFAWVPTQCDEYTVWLEYYMSNQEYGVVNFAELDWIEIDRKPIEKDEQTYL